MNPLLLQVYHRLPAPARSVVAGVRGRYLSWWRYGPDTERLVEEAREREHWPQARWQHFQEERLAEVLWRAAREVPYYEEQWAARRRRGDASSVEHLANWPILEKEPLRADSRRFLAKNCNPSTMFHEHTSGTSGTSLDLWWSRDTVRQWYALFEARTRQWYGVSRQHRWAILGGQLVAAVSTRRPPFWVWNSALNQLYMSSYHLAPDLVPSYLDALRRYEIEYLFGYTSSLYALAQEALRLGRRDPSVKVAITNAEPVFEHQREAIAAAFQCPVRETYGMAEIVAAASECEHGRLHLWPEVGIVEIAGAGDAPAPVGEDGDLVCTGLLNREMPLIRYRVGDRGAQLPYSRCACARTLPALCSVDGRRDDVLYTTDGRPIGRLDPVFKGYLPIREAQIIQETLERVRVRFVPASDFVPGALDSMTARLRARLGPVQVVTEQVDDIPRTSRGKFRSVVCEVPPELVERVRLAALETRGVQ
jgi:phenylacetate-CoA ligase